MNKKKQIGMAILAMFMTASVTAWAANDPLTISADTLSYDGNTGMADANGNVVITQADKTMTGANGWYNTKTQEANLDGGVSMIGSDMAMSAESVHSYNNNKFTANGGVHYNVAIVKFSVIKLNIIQIQSMVLYLAMLV